MRRITTRTTTLCFALLFTMLLSFMGSCSAISTENTSTEKDIEILDKKIEVTRDAYDVDEVTVTLKIKNNYSSIIKTSFNVNIYIGDDDAAFATISSNIIMLPPDESGYIFSTTTVPDNPLGYSYKVIHWDFYNV